MTELTPPIRSDQNAETLPERFLNRFFQEKNIKWLLIIGAAIVFGSSLMLVSKNWPQWSAELKFLTVLGYSAIVFASGEFACRRLSLKTTGGVLQSLTLLLVPLCFYSLHWLSSGSATLGWNALTFWGLLTVTSGFLWVAATRILDHVLKERQLSFLLAYCLLAIAGVLPVADKATVAFGLMVCFAALMWLGVAKVSAHTFWLTESHRKPRIYGFIPMGLLGLMFSLLVWLKVTAVLPTEWLGLGLVMSAAIVLHTTRTLVVIDRKRNGALSVPLPTEIVVPLAVSLVLIAAAVSIAFRGFHLTGETSVAIIPTAALAAIVLMSVGFQLRKTSFVFLSLVCACISYQCSPLLFSELVATVRQTAASAMHRERVPLSMYGMTYLPLLLTIAATARCLGSQSFAFTTLKRYATTVCLLLWCLSLNDLTACFLVTVVNAIAWSCFAVLFKDRRYGIATTAALVIATGLAIPALDDLQIASWSRHWTPVLMTMVGLCFSVLRWPNALLVSLPIPDRCLVRHLGGRTDSSHSWLLQRPDGTDRNFVGLVGDAILLVSGVYWVAGSMLSLTSPLSTPLMIHFGLLMLVLFLRILRRPDYWAGAGFWLLLALAAVRLLSGLAFSPVQLATQATILVCSLTLLLRWPISYWTKSHQDSLRKLRVSLKISPEPQRDRARFSQSFVVPLYDFSVLILLGLVACFHLPSLAALHVSKDLYLRICGWPVATAIVSLWAIVLAVVFRSRMAMIANALLLPFCVSAACLVCWAPAPLLCPLIWVSTVAVMSFCCRTSQDLMLKRILNGWLILMLVFTTLHLSVPLRIAGILSMVLLAIEDSRHRTLDKMQRSYLLVGGGLQSILLAAALGGVNGILLHLAQSPAAAVMLMMLACVVNVVVCDRMKGKVDGEVSKVWSAMLRILFVLLWAHWLTDAREFSNIMVFGTLSLAGISEAAIAIRRQDKTAAIGFAIVLFGFPASLILTNEISQNLISYGLMIAGCLTFAATKGISDGSTQILQRPLRLFTIVVPAIAGLLAIVHQNMFVLFAISLQYAVMAVTSGHRRYGLVAVFFGNFAVLSVCREWNWNRLEFTLVPLGFSMLAVLELLKKEIPSKAHSPIRYAGTLTILASPLLKIVDGNWVAMLTLMVLCVIIVLLAIGLRQRAFLYGGTTFLMVDLLAICVHSTIANPILLWIGGLVLGFVVIVTAASFENHREVLLSRIRQLSAQLATWQ